ncbi:hypothetical protein YTPLAS18_36860 [Nitrospira sp.]|nr:hypothetical protein YTPLAS18_36860 [Nitrospira sp.]
MKSATIGIVLMGMWLSMVSHAAEPMRPDDALGAYYDWYKGKHLYERHCQFCHGVSGNGSGYDQVTPPPADLTGGAVQGRSDAELVSLIHGGKPGTAMGAWNWALSELDRYDVVRYIRSLAQ